MAYDKVIDSSLLDGNLISIANAIREKAGLDDSFAFPQGFIDAIASISAGGGLVTEVATASFAEDTVKHNVPFSKFKTPLLGICICTNNDYNEAHCINAMMFFVIEGSLYCITSYHGASIGSSKYSSDIDLLDGYTELPKRKTDPWAGAVPSIYYDTNGVVFAGYSNSRALFASGFNYTFVVGGI